jgi:hypothetical protein
MGIWRTPVDGGQEKYIISAPIGIGSWVLVEDGIYYKNYKTLIGSTGRGNLIEFYDFDSDSVSLIMELRDKTLSGLAVSPDRRWLLYGQLDQHESDIMLVENWR